VNACPSFSVIAGPYEFRSFAHLWKSHWGKGDEAKVWHFYRPDGLPKGASIITLDNQIDIFPTQPGNKILVRAEYDELIQLLEQQADSLPPVRSTTVRGAVVTGQPGIGKDCLLVFNHFVASRLLILETT
jgi:hypothetical protein